MGVYGHFSLIYHFSVAFLSLWDGPMLAEILSQRSVKPKTRFQPTISVFGIFDYCSAVYIGDLKLHKFKRQSF